jgi:hypothetical protein
MKSIWSVLCVVACLSLSTGCESPGEFEINSLKAAPDPEKGDRNISIWKDDSGTWLEVRQVVSTIDAFYLDSACNKVEYKAVKKVEGVKGLKFNLKGGAPFEIWVKKNGVVQVQKSGAKEFVNGRKAPPMALTKTVDFKIIPNLFKNGTVAFVGGQDTREVTGKTVDYRIADLKYHWFYSKKIRVWLDGDELVIVGTKQSNLKEYDLNTCDLGYKHWGKTFSYNPSGTVWCNGGCP